MKPIFSGFSGIACSSTLADIANGAGSMTGLEVASGDALKTRCPDHAPDFNPSDPTE